MNESQLNSSAHNIRDAQPSIKVINEESPNSSLKQRNQAQNAYQSKNEEIRDSKQMKNDRGQIKYSNQSYQRDAKKEESNLMPEKREESIQIGQNNETFKGVFEKDQQKSEQIR